MDDTRPTPKPWIDRIHAYVPGASKAADGRELVKLSANENPLGCSPAALAAREAARHPALYPDPDSTALREAIAAVHGLDPARVVCGTGSGELLAGAVQGFCGTGDEVLFSEHAFSLYPLLAAKVGAEAVTAPARDYAADVDALLAAVTERTRVLLLDNPNNPTGTAVPHAEVERLHAGLLADVLLVIDQAYAEYQPPEEANAAFALAGRAENVLVTRTFSKAYGLAGERVGWATGAPHLIDILNRLRGPFNVASGAQATALAALGDQAFVDSSRAHNAGERDRFEAALAPLGNAGVRVLPSAANFVLVLFADDAMAARVQAALAEGGYAVRHLGGALGNALRITIGSAQHMDEVAILVRAAVENTE